MCRQRPHFQEGYLVVNGNKDHIPSNYKFYVNGNAGGTSAWAQASDLRLKTAITSLPNALAKVMQLRGVNYQWKAQPETGTQLGFIAQEVEEVIPEVVKHDGDTYSMQYAPINALLVEAVKEQQNEIEQLRKHNDTQDQKISELESLLMMLEKQQKEENRQMHFKD